MKIDLEKERNTIQVGDLVQLEGGRCGIRMVIMTQNGMYALLELETATETCIGESIEHLAKVNKLALYAKNEDLVLTRKA